ncbi:MAG: J domain-containing protein [Thermomicrobiales bacterium]|nr:J domain-containing protein [Thermomicrobiales bacterium]
MAKVEFKDYYKILGVERTADDKALRGAFRKLARKHHPDINPGDAGAEERFKEVNEAYEVLSDAEKRKLYDRYGEDWRRYKEAGFTGDEPAGSRQRQSSSTADFGEWFSGSTGGGRTTTFDFGEEASGYSSFFDTLFGGRRSGRSSSTFGAPDTRPRRGQDLEAAVDVSFQEAFRGTTRRFDIQSQEICPTCDGTGLIRNSTCPTCDGTGYVPRNRSIEVTIPPGVATGSKIRVAGQGSAGLNSGPAGDVYLNVTVHPDSRFEREGNNLRTTIDVPYDTALLGGEVLVSTPTGQVALRIPEGTQSGKSFRLKGQGMPQLKKPAERGDLLARVNITVPASLSSQEKSLVEQLRKLREGA